MVTMIPTNGLQASAWAMSSRTNWFSEFCASSLLSLKRAAQSWQRNRDAKSRIDAQFEARLSERVQVARFFHDALLQGLANAYMEIQRADAELGCTVDLLRAARPEHPTGASLSGTELVRAITQMSDAAASRYAITFRATAIGAPRMVSPETLDEILVIGREALANAFSHSCATQIEVDVEYASAGLRILIRDNGCGIDAQTLRDGRAGHSGLSDMREHAAGMGARFRVLTGEGVGTEVELRVPAEVAFLAGQETTLDSFANSVEEGAAVS